MSNDTWNLHQTLEGMALILGKGFDYDGALVYNKENGIIIIRAPYPSKKTDENYPYPNILELCIPLDQVRDLIK